MAFRMEHMIFLSVSWIYSFRKVEQNKEERGRELFQLVEGRVTRYEGRIVSDRPGKWTILADKGRATFVEFEFHFTLLECCEVPLVDFFSTCSFLYFPRDTRYMADIRRFQIEGVREKKTESRYLRNPFIFFLYFFSLLPSFFHYFFQRALLYEFYLERVIKIYHNCRFKYSKFSFLHVFFSCIHYACFNYFH